MCVLCVSVCMFSWHLLDSFDPVHSSLHKCHCSIIISRNCLKPLCIHPCPIIPLEVLENAPSTVAVPTHKKWSRKEKKWKKKQRKKCHFRIIYVSMGGSMNVEVFNVSYKYWFSNRVTITAWNYRAMKNRTYLRSLQSVTVFHLYWSNHLRTFICEKVPDLFTKLWMQNVA